MLLFLRLYYATWESILHAVVNLFHQQRNVAKDMSGIISGVYLLALVFQQGVEAPYHT